MLGEGCSLREIGDRLGVSHMTVARAANTAGLATNGAVPEAAVRAWMAKARLAQVRHMAEAFELSDMAKAKLLDALDRDDVDLASVQTFNAVAGTWEDKGIAFARLFKDAAEVEQRQQAADKLTEMTEAILSAAEQGVPQPRM